jgi:hypothetical protein
MLDFSSDICEKADVREHIFIACGSLAAGLNNNLIVFIAA